jgi:hypothetical protein
MCCAPASLQMINIIQKCMIMAPPVTHSSSSVMPGGEPGVSGSDLNTDALLGVTEFVTAGIPFSVGTVTVVGVLYFLYSACTTSYVHSN